MESEAPTDLLPFGRRYGAKCGSRTFRRLVAALPFASFKKAVRIYRTILKPPFDPNEIAYLACNDRFFLLTHLLRRKDALHPWIYARCRMVERAPDNFLDLWSRYHYKSSIITFAGSIQEIVRDPEITIAIFSIDRGMARKFLGQIKDELELNNLMAIIFPDVFFVDPKKEASNWSADGITVKRNSNPKESTVDAYGLLNGLPAGPHYALRVYDDVVTQKVTTQTATDQRKKISINWQLSQNLGGAGADRKWHSGTRYSWADLYGQQIRNSVLTPRLFPATHNGRLDGKPVFLSQAKWDEIKNTQRDVVAAQFLQNPMAGNEATFSIAHLRAYALIPRVMNVYILADPSAGRGRKSDRTAIIVIGIDAAMNAYFLDGYCHRMRLSERWENLKALHGKWSKHPGVRHVRVGYERYGMQTDMEFFEREMERTGAAMDIVEVSWTSEGDQSKTQRIGRLEPWFRNSRIWMPPRVWLPVKGECLWHIEGGDENDENAKPPDIVYTPLGPGQLTRWERDAIAAGEPWRCAPPIKRINEDRDVYDLTSTFFEEYVKHPFGEWDDALDAASRIEDIDAHAPAAGQFMRDLEPLPVD